MHCTQAHQNMGQANKTFLNVRRKRSWKINYVSWSLFHENHWMTAHVSILPSVPFNFCTLYLELFFFHFVYIFGHPRKIPQINISVIVKISPRSFAIRNNNNTEDFVARTYPPCWVLKARIQKHQGKPLLFHDKCPGFFYVHYTTHGTYSFTSHPKDEAIMVKCLAQGHKRRDRPGRDPNPHSDNTRTWVQCTRPLGHDTP